MAEPPTPQHPGQPEGLVAPTFGVDASAFIPLAERLEAVKQGDAELSRAVYLAALQRDPDLHGDYAASETTSTDSAFQLIYTRLAGSHPFAGWYDWADGTRIAEATLNGEAVVRAAHPALALCAALLRALAAQQGAA